MKVALWERSMVWNFNGKEEVMCAIRWSEATHALDSS